MENLINLDTLRSIFGQCVFLKWPPGTKGGCRPWKHLTLADMTPEYLGDLFSGNIGIALGQVSGGICAIDLDDERLVQPFLRMNPWTSQTAITRGARGCQVWARIIGDYPPSCKFKTSGSPHGEWRADGCQSIIPPSIHPATGQPYIFISKCPVAKVQYNEIQLPSGTPGFSMGELVETQQTQQPNQTKHTTEYTQLCHPFHSSTTTTEDCHPLTSSLTVTDDCHGFHGALVEPHVATEKGHNNAKLFRLAQAIKLAMTLGKPVDADLAFRLWWEQSEPFTKRTLNRDTYRCEFRRALGAVDGDPIATAWMASAGLSAPGTELLHDNNMKRLAAFCHCLRDSDGRFYLSCRTVGTLFDLHHQDAYLWLRALEDYGLIRAIHRGSQKAHKATEYQYTGRSSTQ